MSRNSGIIYLPIAAMISALFMPVLSGKVSSTLQTLFIPIAWPTFKAGSTIRNRLLPEQMIDPLSPGAARTLEQYKKQNAELLNELANLREQLKDLEELSAQIQIMGTELRKIVKPAVVMGTSPDHRKSLMISTANLAEVRAGAAVVHPLGFVGRIDAVGLAGGNARVQLLTDPASRITGKFVRFVTQPNGAVEIKDLMIPPPLIEGTGKGLVARQMETLPIRQNLKVGDSVILDDQQQFPQPALKGQRIGIVSKINLPSTDSRRSEVEITPVTDYTRLPEVMVVVK